MKQLCIFLSFLLVLSCATKHKVKEIEKVEIKQENHIQQDTVANYYSTVKKNEDKQRFQEFSNLLKTFNITYNGENDDSLYVTLSNDEGEQELKIKGKGKINYNEQSEINVSFAKENKFHKIDSINFYESNKNETTTTNSKTNTYNRFLTKDKIDLSIWIYLSLVIILGLWIVINLIAKRFKR